MQLLPPALTPISVDVYIREREKGGTATDQKMVITLTETIRIRITAENWETTGKARPSCCGGCPTVSLRRR